MRGVYQASYLDTFATHMLAAGSRPGAVDVGKAFDLIVGTSTGAIVACALAAGVSLKTVAAMYLEHGHEIFPGQWVRSVPLLGTMFRGSGLGLRRGDAALRRYLATVFGRMTMGRVYSERHLALAVPAVDLSRHVAVVFKTQHRGHHDVRDIERSLVDVCLATTAAPILRSMARLSEPGRRAASTVYVDGGLWANSPGVVAFVEAVDILGDRAEPHRPIHLFMLGTLPAPADDEVAFRSVHRGAAGWRFGLGVLEASLSAQSVGYDGLASKLAQFRRDGSLAYRLPAQTPADDLQGFLANMDDARSKVLEALARQAVSDADRFWANDTPGEAQDPGARAFREALNAAPIR